MALTPPPSGPPAAPTAPGDAPSRANPSTFRELADAFVVWQVGFRDWLAGMVAWLAGYITWASANVTEMGALQADVQGNANTSATNAASAAAGAAEVEANRAALDNRLYPGTYAADPVTRPNGSAVQAGDRYFNSSIARQKTYSGSVWATDNLDSTALALPGGSALSGHIDDAAGAVAETVQSKLRETKTPETFGASTGASAATNLAAFAAGAAAGVNIVLPAGRTYNVGGSFTLTGVSISGPGTLNFTSGCLILGSGSRAFGIKVRGNGKTNGSHGIDTVAAADDVAVIRCDVRDTSLNGIRGNASTRLRFLNNDVDNCGDPATINVTFQGMGIYCDTCVNVEVSLNRISRSYGHGGVFMLSCTDFKVTENKISRTFFRGVEAYGATQDRGLIAANHVTRAGDINTSGSGVGCNGIYVSGPTAPPITAVLVVGNYVAQVGENGIEGSCTARCNTVVQTGFYPGLATPSKEGIFVTGGICEDNVVVGAAEEGILSFRGGATSGMSIKRNMIISPTLAGVKVQMDTAAGVLTNSEIDANTVHGENDAAQPGVQLIVSNGGSFTSNSNTLRNNTVFGRATNSVTGTWIRSHNSFDSEHSLTLTDGSRRTIGSSLNSANGGFRRWMLGYGIDFDGTNFQVDNLAQLKPFINFGNNELTVGVVPTATTGAQTTGQVSAFDRMRITDTKLILRGLPTASAGLSSGELWNNAGVINIVP